MLSTLAIRFAGPTIPSVVLALSPGVVLVLESRLMAERVGPVVLVSTCVAIGGAILFIWPRLSGATTSTVVWGVLAAIGAMFSMAIYGLYFARVHRNYHGPLTPRILPIFGIGSIPLLAWAAVDVLTGQQITAATLLILAVLGLVIYVPTYLVQHRILLTAGPAYAALLGLAVPPLVALTSFVLGLAKPPDLVQFAGITLTLVGMTVVIRARYVEPDIIQEKKRHR
jgi:drug/metabolite transporter (DMT)-like permease